MSLEGWARAQARDRYQVRYSAALGAGAVRNAREQAFAEGIVHAFSALLSDEAVEAAARVIVGGDDLYEYPYNEAERLQVLGRARATLKAAVRAVTEGEKP